MLKEDNDKLKEQENNDMLPQTSEFPQIIKISQTSRNRYHASIMK